MRRQPTEVWQTAIIEGKRWNEHDAAAALASWKASGESFACFARRHGLVAQRLYWWRRRLARGGRDVREPSASSTRLIESRLLPVTVRGGNSIGRAVVVVLGDDVRIEVEDPQAVPPAWLAMLIRMAREA